MIRSSPERVSRRKVGADQQRKSEHASEDGRVIDEQMKMGSGEHFVSSGWFAGQFGKFGARAPEASCFTSPASARTARNFAC